MASKCTFFYASETAMMAVVFSRIAANSHVECISGAAKTPVAPIKYYFYSKARTASCDYWLGMAASVTKNLTMNIFKQTYWIDSSTVLCWLRADLKRYSVFVGSRSSKILKSTDINEWRWVPSRFNAVDDGTMLRNQPDLSSEIGGTMDRSFS